MTAPRVILARLPRFMLCALTIVTMGFSEWFTAGDDHDRHYGLFE
jgi:hypothetical protein